MIYTLDELREKIAPIAEKYRIPAVYIFGSYARGEATEESDVDVLIEHWKPKTGSLFELGGLYNDLSRKLQKELDIVEAEALDDEMRRRMPWFVNNIIKEKVLVYGHAGYPKAQAHAAVLPGH